MMKSDSSRLPTVSSTIGTSWSRQEPRTSQLGSENRRMVVTRMVLDGMFAKLGSRIVSLLFIPEADISTNWITVLSNVTLRE